MGYIRQWFKDALTVCRLELKNIFHDGGVLIIFGVAGLGYPLLYNAMYHNGVLEDTPVAVVDMANCQESRRYAREVDATREVNVAYKCASMEEAKSLMQKRKVNGVIYFPEDFGEKIARRETATLSIYADMSSFLYYKNLMMGANFVMLDEMQNIEIERYCATGMTEQEARQLTQAIPYEENNPYNKAFSYTIFFLPAVMLLVIQQVMFYGMSLLAGTEREEKRSFARLKGTLGGPGVSRIVLGRGAAYWLLFMIIGIYVSVIVPSLFGLPQRTSFWNIIILLLFFVTDCVFFATTWSTFITRRESVFLLLLFISPIALFLTGFSWPVSAFPNFWKWFSYLFPTTFGCRAFINLNSAGGDLLTVRELIRPLVLQTIIYTLLSYVAIYVENFVIKKREVQTSSPSDILQRA